VTPALLHPGGRRLPGPRYLIVNGDDFGLTQGVTDGILSAWQKGILTSTTAMVNLPGALERVVRACRQHPGLPIGLHLNLVHGRPVLPPEQVPSLVDRQGCFLPLLELVPRLPQVAPEEVRLECFAQAERLQRGGVMFDHIDCHQGLPAAYTPFLPIMLDLAHHYRVPLRNPAPASTYRGLGLSLPGSRLPGQALLALGRFVVRRPRTALAVLRQLNPAAFQRSAAALGQAGIATTNWFVDAWFQHPDRDSLVALIERLPPGVSELGCHPAEVDADLRRSGDGYVEPRAGELAALLDPHVKDALRRSQVQLVDFSFVRG